ncbi:MAG TPA: hypothetical protein QF753_00905 [Victivallales bacterium]|nr:hypothetical protein [Victivallales bacterium]|tara:strand:+ start:128 stop:697 length:570 start_codon:yes stop_codon:yes gene_type:complete
MRINITKKEYEDLVALLAFGLSSASLYHNKKDTEKLVSYDKLVAQIYGLSEKIGYKGITIENDKCHLNTKVFDFEILLEKIFKEYFKEQLLNIDLNKQFEDKSSDEVKNLSDKSIHPLINDLSEKWNQKLDDLDMRTFFLKLHSYLNTDNDAYITKALDKQKIKSNIVNDLYKKTKSKLIWRKLNNKVH